MDNSGTPRRAAGLLPARICVYHVHAAARRAAALGVSEASAIRAVNGRAPARQQNRRAA